MKYLNILITIFLYINILLSQDVRSWSNDITVSKYTGFLKYQSESDKVLTEFMINKSGDTNSPIIGKYMYQTDPDSPYLMGELMEIKIIDGKIKAKWFEKTFVGPNQPTSDSWGYLFIISNDGWKSFSGYFTNENNDDEIGNWNGDRIYFQDGPNGFKPPEKNNSDENLLKLFYDEYAGIFMANEFSDLLDDIYFSYITIKNCYDTRKTKLGQYIDLQTYEKYRGHTKKMENYLISSLSNEKNNNITIDTDQIWLNASETFNNSIAGMIITSSSSNYNKEAETSCSLAKLYFVQLEIDYKEILRETIKKDF